MKKYIQLGGFIQDVGFYDTAVPVLQNEIDNHECIVFVASRPDEHRANDERVICMLAWFKAIGIHFEHHVLVDSRVEAMPLNDEISNSSCIFLMGGETLKQNELIVSLGLEKVLMEFNSIIIGLSAGAINLAKLNIVPSLVAPHFDQRPTEYIETVILPLSYKQKVFGLCENGVILHKDGEMNLYGDIYEIENGVSKKVSSK